MALYLFLFRALSFSLSPACAQPTRPRSTKEARSAKEASAEERREEEGRWKGTQIPASFARKLPTTTSTSTLSRAPPQSTSSVDEIAFSEKIYPKLFGNKIRFFSEIQLNPGRREVGRPG